MKLRILLAIAVAAMIAVSATARADTESDLKAKVDALQKQLDELKAQLNNVVTSVQQTKQAQQEQEKKNESFLARKPGQGLTFLAPGGGDVTVYGNFDVSFDDTTKGLQSNYANGGSPVGNMGWLPAISTNGTYVGVRGRHPFGKDPNETEFIWQLEGEIIVAAQSGVGDNNSAQSNVVKGALTTRDSYVGFSGTEWGAVKIGKENPPYDKYFSRFNPFSQMIGDMKVIMGNTGGDNRVEFGSRLDHAIWYESPNWNGFSFSALYSPGQNRSDDSSNISAGESDCSGGNVPGSGALPPSCNDGAFSNAFSVGLGYQWQQLYLAFAYEVHQKVNRSSDTIGFPTTPPQDTQGDPNDVAQENAWRIGAQYVFPTKTTVGFIYEKFKRDVPAYLEYQNERQRSGTWLMVSQAVTEKDVASFGWAHAGGTPGDPGQHNTSFGPNPDNEANMYTLLWRHFLDRDTSIYGTWALTDNHSAAHYDLGAGGRAVTTDCHDATQMAAFDPTANGGAGGVSGGGPHCFAGGRLQGFSVGVNYKF
jgi:predicted porin